MRASKAACQRALAEKLEKSYSYIAKCETGYVRMDIYQICEYLKAVDMPLSKFMQRYGKALEA